MQIGGLKHKWWETCKHDVSSKSKESRSKIIPHPSSSSSPTLTSDHRQANINPSIFYLNSRASISALNNTLFLYPSTITKLKHPIQLEGISSTVTLTHATTFLHHLILHSMDQIHRATFHLWVTFSVLDFGTVWTLSIITVYIILENLPNGNIIGIVQLKKTTCCPSIFYHFHLLLCSPQSTLTTPRILSQSASLLPHFYSLKQSNIWNNAPLPH